MPFCVFSINLKNTDLLMFKIILFFRMFLYAVDDFSIYLKNEKFPLFVSSMKKTYGNELNQISTVNDFCFRKYLQQ